MQPVTGSPPRRKKPSQRWGGLCRVLLLPAAVLTVILAAVAAAVLAVVAAAVLIVVLTVVLVVVLVAAVVTVSGIFHINVIVR